MIGFIIPVVLGIAFVTWFILEGIYEKEVWKNSAELFVPTLGTKMVRAGGYKGGRGGYAADGHFQGWEIHIFGKKLGFLKGRFGVCSVFVVLKQYRYKSKRLGGSGKLPSDGKVYFIRQNQLWMSQKEIKTINQSRDIAQAVKVGLEGLCRVAQKVDSGEINCDSLVES
ncbi:hypothetical protein ACFL38_02240 [Candidatus Omnitrophota bacterium]